jgi:hypothetical protein
MSTLLLGIWSAAAAFMGMAALCVQSKNQRHRMGWREQTVQQRCIFVALGALLLAASLAMAVRVNGLSFGIVLWLCQTGVLGLALICSLPYLTTRTEGQLRVPKAIAFLTLAIACASFITYT